MAGPKDEVNDWSLSSDYEAAKQQAKKPKEPKPKPGEPKKDKKKGKDKLSKKEAEEKYQSGIADFGWSIAFFKSIPALWKLFNQAIDENWTASRFQAAVKNTKWYKTHRDTWRKAYALKYTDPATYKANREEMRTNIRDLAGRMGVVLSTDQINKIAGSAMWSGWTEAQMRNALANYVAQTGKDGYDGEAGVAEDELRAYAYKMGVRFSDAALKSWLGNILRGNKTIDAYKNWIQNESVKMFPMLKDQIMGGETVADLASPYIQSMSAILEISPSSINLFDPTVRKAMSFGNGEMMPLWAFENELRKDPRWMQTNNARTGINTIGLQVLKDFGFQA